MNTKPDAITILCYGDSNTWGQKPDKKNRYAANERWTGLLQQSLGEQYYVIEEGLSSRTTDVEFSKKPGRNGKTYLLPCLQSHNPIDIVVMMLGTNDFKIEFDRTAPEIATAIGGLIDDSKNYAWNNQRIAPHILVVSPILVNGQAPHFAEIYAGIYDQTAVGKSQALAGELQKVVSEKGCHFLDAATVAKAGSDGIHFDVASHPALAALVAAEIRRL